MRLHHVQLSMPVGQEEVARSFYRDTLGMTEVDKPLRLAGRGGCWFRAFDDAGLISAEIHMGTEDPFTAQRKAHPGLRVESSSRLNELGRSIAAAGFEVSWSEQWSFEGFERFHCNDGFGNRIEILADRS